MKTSCGNVELGQRWRFNPHSGLDKIVEVVTLPAHEGLEFKVRNVQIICGSTYVDEAIGEIHYYGFNNPPVWEYLEGQDKPQ